MLTYIVIAACLLAFVLLALYRHKTIVVDKDKKNLITAVIKSGASVEKQEDKIRESHESMKADVLDKKDQAESSITAAAEPVNSANTPEEVADQWNDVFKQ